MQPDPAKLDAFMGKMVTDMGAAASAALILIGDKLGLYKALAQIGPAAPMALADKTQTAERYIREWLAAQAAAGYVQYHAENGTYSMTPEQAVALADESSPAFVAGAFDVKHNSRLDGARVLLVDDVLTTGATAAACARTLKRVMEVR